MFTRYYDDFFGNHLYVKLEVCLPLYHCKLPWLYNWWGDHQYGVWFLGFAIFYWRFIKNFSSIAAAHRTLISSQVNFQWNKAAKAFRTLKKRFTPAPVLTITDPKLQFVLEVDASEVGIGAVLSQRSTKPAISLGLSLQKTHFHWTELQCR